jgi:flagellar protein FliO/FliZ
MTNPLFPLLAFAFVVAMIPLSLWLAKRGGFGGVGTPGLLRQVASLSLSSSQRVVVVELAQDDGPRWLVLGVSADRIAHLTTLDALPAVPTAVAQPQALSAAMLIQRWSRRKPEADDAH